MYRVRFYNRATGESIFRNYKWKEPREIEAIARRNKWIVAKIEREV
jgi:hypothetical protein